MSVRYHDWYGRYKLVDFCGYICLIGPNVGPMEASEWWMKATGKRPDIRTVYEVDAEFYNRWMELYIPKGYHFDGEDGGNEL